MNREFINREKLDEMLAESVSSLREQMGEAPPLLVQTGSGLSLTGSAQLEIEYGKIPHFPVPSAPGHAGMLRLVKDAPRPYVHLLGRAHYYAGYPAWQLGLPIRALHQLGVRDVVIISATGAINETFAGGDIVLIHDFINFTAINPLRGIAGEGGMMEFPAMRVILDAEMEDIAHRAARSAGVALRRGIYAMSSGPAYETIAELKALRALGADAVGMSTIPELMTARALDMRSCAVALITNNPMEATPTHDEVIAGARRAQATVERWFNELLKLLAGSEK
jgi:purine-nucleoside phosphorylase